MNTERNRNIAVSYTHLRFIEVKPLFRRTDVLAGTLDVVTFEQGRDDGGTGGRRTDTRIPVSYTHLDVYKRQHLETVCNRCGYAVLYNDELFDNEPFPL